MNWQKVRLGDLCIMNSGGTPSRSNLSYYGGSTPWAKISDIENAVGGVIYQTEEYITSDGLSAINNRIFEAGILLLAMYGSVGKVAFTGVKMSTNQAILGIRIINEFKLNYSYLKYWFMTIKARLLDRAVGGTLQNISLGIVREIEIPLPPLDVQKKIADILDKADALRRKDAELIKKYDELAQSIFIDMFGDPVTNTKNWEKLPIHKIGTVKTGNTPSRSNKKFYGNHIEWIKTDNIKMDSIYPANASEYLSQDGLNVGRYVEQDSILVTCIAGSANTIGNVVLTDRKVAFNQQINSLTPNENHEPLFIYFLFRNIKRYIQLSTTEGMKRIITKSAFENLELISPPLELQRLFCNRIQKYVDSKKMLNNIYSEQLFQSLLQRAFNGELVH